MDHSHQETHIFNGLSNPNHTFISVVPSELILPLSGISVPKAVGNNMVSNGCDPQSENHALVLSY